MVEGFCCGSGSVNTSLFSAGEEVNDCLLVLHASTNEIFVFEAGVEEVHIDPVLVKLCTNTNDLSKNRFDFLPVCLWILQCRCGQPHGR